jgi:hypothetical protein
VFRSELMAVSQDYLYVGANGQNLGPYLNLLLKSVLRNNWTNTAKVRPNMSLQE